MSLILGAIQRDALVMLGDRATWSLKDGKVGDVRISEVPKIAELDSTPRLLVGIVGAYRRNYILEAQDWAKSAHAFPDVTSASIALWEYLLGMHLADFGRSREECAENDLSLGMGVVTAGYDNNEPVVVSHDVSEPAGTVCRRNDSVSTCCWWAGNSLHFEHQGAEVQALERATTVSAAEKGLIAIARLSEKRGTAADLPSCRGPFDLITYERGVGVKRSTASSTFERPGASSGMLPQHSHSLKVTPFGGSSGVTASLTNGGMSGFAATTGNSTVQQYPLNFGGVVVLSAEIALGSTSSPGGLYMGDTTNGIGIEFATDGSVQTVYYSGGSRHVIETVIAASGSSDTLMHTYTLTFVATGGPPLVGNVSGMFDSTPSPTIGGKAASTLPSFGSTFSVTIAAGGTSGIAQNLSIRTSTTSFLNNISTVTPDANGSCLRSGIVYADQIKWSSGSPTGPVSLDSVPDGSTYARVKGQNLNNGNLATPFNSTALYHDANGNIAGFSSATEYATNNAYPLAASFKLVASGWLKQSTTSSNVFFMIGNQTNGIGMRWNTGGTVSLAVFKGGTGTFTTEWTVTRDTNLHWFSVIVTPGSTPGSSDSWTITFDKNTASGTTGASAITWGSTATGEVQMSGSGGIVSDYRFTSANA